MLIKRVEEVLFFLTILFLPTQLGRHFWPQFSFVYSLPIDYLSPVLYFWDILMLVLWVVFLISGKHINRLALIFFYFFILTQALSLAFNPPSVGVGLIRLEQYTIAGLFGVYIASLKKGEIGKIYLPLTLAIFGEAFLAILQFLKGGSVGLWILGERTFSLSTPAIAKFDFYGREFLRPYSTFSHPNVLAGFMVSTILLLSFLRKQESIQIKDRSQIKFGMTRVVIYLSSITIILTVSRTAIFAGLTSAFILLKNKNRILLFLLVIILSPILLTRFSSLVNFDNLTLLRREELSKTALNLWTSHPLFGVGLNNFIPTAADAILAGPSRFLQPVHNIFLLSLSETGIIGLMGLISLIGYPLYKKKLLIVWASIIFLGLFDHYFLTLPQGYRLLFLVWGISLSSLREVSMLEWKSAKSG